MVCNQTHGNLDLDRVYSLEKRQDETISRNPITEWLVFCNSALLCTLVSDVKRHGKAIRFYVECTLKKAHAETRRVQIKVDLCIVQPPSYFT